MAIRMAIRDGLRTCSLEDRRQVVGHGAAPASTLPLRRPQRLSRHGPTVIRLSSRTCFLAGASASALRSPAAAAVLFFCVTPTDGFCIHRPVSASTGNTSPATCSCPLPSCSSSSSCCSCCFSASSSGSGTDSETFRGQPRPRCWTSTSPPSGAAPFVFVFVFVFAAAAAAFGC